MSEDQCDSHAKPSHFNEPSDPCREDAVPQECLPKPYILIVDDCRHQRYLLSRFLAKYHCHTEAHPSEALRRHAENPACCIISDDTMPKMTGRQLAQYVAAKHTRVPFILITGRDDLARGTYCGVDRVFIKPARPDDVRKCIAELLQET